MILDTNTTITATFRSDGVVLGAHVRVANACFERFGSAGHGARQSRGRLSVADLGVGHSVLRDVRYLRRPTSAG